MTFGEKIRDARKAKKLTQRQLADAIGAKHNSVSDWEKDKNKPDMDTIEMICGILDLEPNYLMGNAQSSSENASIVARVMSDFKMIEMIEKFYLLEVEDQNAIRRIIESLNKKKARD